MKRNENKNILYGVCGSIAVYKACETVSSLRKKGYDVTVLMTKAAEEFVSPMTFEAITGKKVVDALFNKDSIEKFGHIDLTKDAALFVIAPASANTISKMANGIADNALTAAFLTSKCPALIAPAMNEKMYLDQATQVNLRKLQEKGAMIIGPEKGFLACGEEGMGRLVANETLLKEIGRILEKKKILLKKNFLVTAGPTREYLDPIRFITNRSSGKMGYAIAEEASMLGADVVLVSGPTRLPKPYGVTLKKVETSEEMLKACLKGFSDYDIIIMTAAVSDFKPLKTRKKKIKKTKELTVAFEKTKDILGEFKKMKRKKQIIIGFAAESEDILKNAKEKLKEKELDLIVANDIRDGFGKDTNKTMIIDGKGTVKRLKRNDKRIVAKEIIEKLTELL